MPALNLPLESVSEHSQSNEKDSGRAESKATCWNAKAAPDTINGHDVVEAADQLSVTLVTACRFQRLNCG